MAPSEVASFEMNFFRIAGTSEAETSVTRQDKTRQLYYYIFAHDTVLTELAPQVAEANRGGPGTTKKWNLLVLVFLKKRNVLQKRQKKDYLRGTRIALVHGGE